MCREAGCDPIGSFLKLDSRSEDDLYISHSTFRGKFYPLRCQATNTAHPTRQVYQHYSGIIKYNVDINDLYSVNKTNHAYKYIRTRKCYIGRRIERSQRPENQLLQHSCWLLFGVLPHCPLLRGTLRPPSLFWVAYQLHLENISTPLYRGYKSKF